MLVSAPTSKTQSQKTPPVPAVASVDLKSPELYVNRELSLLAFQRRVLEEAQDPSNLLLERVKFLSIVGSNLDEFFMVRVAGLQQQVEAGIAEVGPDGMNARGQLVATRREVNSLMRSAQECLRSILPLLEEEGIRIAKYSELTGKQLAIANAYFSETVFPVLTPLAYDPGRPFPHLSNLSLNLAVAIRDAAGAEHFARIKVPDTLPQLVPLLRRVQKSEKKLKPIKQVTMVWLEDLISAHLAWLFPGMEILEAHPFKVTRNADIDIQELEAGDLLETMEAGVRQRRFGDVVRISVSEAMPSHILQILMSELEITRSEVYRVNGPVGFSRLRHLASLDRPDLKDAPFVPAIPPQLDPERGEADIFSAIRQQDILFQHPYDSFQPVVDWLAKAARDPNVLAIKMTLYRVGRNSPVVKALLKAMERGKQVAVLVELKARFDEESNIEWARALEREGVHVVYGLMGLKTHCKVGMVVRREGDTIRRYVHMATGNYNAVTAHLYTDIGMFTCDEEIGADVTDLFNYLTGYSAKTEYRKLLVAPVSLRARLAALIEREIESHKKAGGGHLIFKANSLVDMQMIQLLYKASQAGVKVDLLIRGICCLRPGVAGVSENIRVVSIVGRFLEHSRIYYFRNGGEEEIYLGSADLMPRNINRRVEVLFPLGDPRLVDQVRDGILGVYLKDNVKARLMQADGRYVRAPRRKPLVSSQDVLLKASARKKR
ncbi:MAG: polyphosphate kinase 1 [Bryobacteraceae bacterium]